LSLDVFSIANTQQVAEVEEDVVVAVGAVVEAVAVEVR
jgi:hypothetical protein